MPYKDKELRKKKNNEYQKAHYKKKKQYYLEKARVHAQKYKDFFKLYKAGLKCTVCGEMHSACLEFHHVDPKTKQFNISTAIRRQVKKEVIFKELQKCIVLCANCHRKLHHK